ncbi:TerC family protein [Leptolyngbya sp. AN02str]|uniref:TerC family protein n=1 Tax=Leptolyngbya sp. AN02str TaxID=3423363 RepID=UPI003D31EB3D
MLDALLDWSPNLGVDTLLLLLVLIALEAVLSADNAIALAAIARGLETPKQQQQALNLGLLVAFLLRMLLIVTATWVIKYWQFELAGAFYLLWLVFKYFTSDDSNDGEGHHHGPRFTSLWQSIPVIAFTDLAFSLDSVTTAIALSDELWLILTGGTIGIITLRLMAGLFIRWLKEYTHLEDAGYVTVGLVGLRLLLRVVQPEFVPPEWIMISAIAILFTWGFSKRNELDEPVPATGVADAMGDATENSAAIASDAGKQTQEISAD